MAEAVFDEHPLGEYLRQAGEFDFEEEPEPELLIPGGLTVETDTRAVNNDIQDVLLSWLSNLPELFHAAFLDPRPRHHQPRTRPVTTRTTSFIERFKYSVISSSLLSPSLSPHPHPPQSRLVSNEFSSVAPAAIAAARLQSHSRTQSYEERHEAVSRRISSSSYSSTNSRGASSMNSISTEPDGEASNHGHTALHSLLASSSMFVAIPSPSPIHMALGVLVLLSTVFMWIIPSSMLVVSLTLGAVVLGSFYLDPQDCLAAPQNANVDNEQQNDPEEDATMPPIGVHPALESLNELIAASDAWDAVVFEAIGVVEAEEELLETSLNSPPPSPFPLPVPNSPPQPTTASLRLALHTSLNTTQSQCDNVRALFSALTREDEVIQLMEMYKPASPSPRPKSRVNRFSGVEGFQSTARPRSLPLRTPGGRTPVDVKRSTWASAGSYAYNAAALGGSPTPLKRRSGDKRRSELSELFLSPERGNTPPVLHEVAEEQDQHDRSITTEEDEDEVQDVDVPFLRSASTPLLSPAPPSRAHPSSAPHSSVHFGAAFMDLRRQRYSSGIGAFVNTNSSIPDAYSTPSSSPKSAKRRSIRVKAKSRPTSLMPESHSLPWSSSQVKLTRLQPSTSSSSSHSYSSSTTSATMSPSNFASSPRMMRNMLTLPSLHEALDRAISAKRYVCSHLLALRFQDGSPSFAVSALFRHDDEQGDGEEEEGYWEDVRSVMGLLTSTFSDAAGRLGEAVLETAEGVKRKIELERRDVQVDLVDPFGFGRQATTEVGIGGESGDGFAPMPSGLMRFAAHVEAISGALDDAKEELGRCVSALKDATSKDTSLDQPQTQTTHEEGGAEVEPPALIAYERLRRELGFALRECERGRERLLLLVKPPPLASPDNSSDSDAEAQVLTPRDVNALLPAIINNSIPVAAAPVLLGDSDEVRIHGAEHELEVEAKMLLQTIQGHTKEQVFESAEGTRGGAFGRPRSKLTREERIEAAKAKRESTNLGGSDNRIEDGEGAGGGHGERWGPGGEVVQELKDVIWKVGERRRKLQEGRNEAQTPAPVSAARVDSGPIPVEEQSSSS